MGLDEIEERCSEYGVSILLTLEDRELGKEIRNLKTQIKEIIVRINADFSNNEEYYEIYDLQHKLRILSAKYKRYTNDKIDPFNNDSDLQELLKFEFDDIKKELEELKRAVKNFSDVLLKGDSSGLKDLEWEQFVRERAKNKIANVIVTNRAFDEFEKYFLENSGSKDLTLQAVNGLIDTLKSLEQTPILSSEPASGKMKGSDDVFEYRFTSSNNGGVFRAIYFYDNYKSRIIHSLLFKTEPQAANASREAADNFIKQAKSNNGNRTNNELIDIRINLQNNNVEEYENRILFMYKELFRLRKQFQKNSLSSNHEMVNEDDNKQSGRKNI